MNPYHDTHPATIGLGLMHASALYCPLCQQWRLSIWSYLTPGEDPTQVLLDRTFDMGPFDSTADAVTWLAQRIAECLPALQQASAAAI